MLGALAAGAWAMTQEVPSKGPTKSSTQSASRSRTDATPRRDATAPRPKPKTNAEAESTIVRPKADVAQRPVKPAPQKLAAAPRPDGEPARKSTDIQRPKAPVTQPKTSAGTRAQAELKTSSIAKAPKPAPRPAAATTRVAKANDAKPAAPAPSLNVLYTSTTAYLRKRPEIAAPVLHKLKQGDAVRVFARDGKWTLVSASGRKGWLHDDVLKPADPAAPRPKEALAAPAKTANPG